MAKAEEGRRYSVLAAVGRRGSVRPWSVDGCATVVARLQLLVAVLESVELESPLLDP